MRKHTAGAVALSLLLAASGQAAGGRITGVLASVEGHAAPTLLQITAQDREEQQVRTDPNTHYVKWITHQPWQQDTRTNTAALVAGRCVDVQLRSGDASIATIVRISDEPSGSIYDPCKARR
jgi:hypothetical protein